MQVSDPTIATPYRHRTAWISDLHLGSKGCNAEAILSFLRLYDFETLYLVGDLIDIWKLRRGIYWPQSHSNVIQKILRKGRKGTKVIYIPGNHNEFVASFFGNYGGITMQREAIHVTADGRRLLVLHGHELDTVVQNIRWLAFIGDVGYEFLLRLNRPLNFVRRLLGLHFWSLSACVKMNVKNAVSFIGEFEQGIVRYSREYKVDGVVCGHIHTPVIRNIEGVEYYNCGDWVESCSVLLEDFDGHIELRRGLFVNPDEAAAAAKADALAETEEDEGLSARGLAEVEARGEQAAREPGAKGVREPGPATALK